VLNTSRNTSGCDDMLKLYLEKYVGRISRSGDREERKDRWREDKTSETEPSTMPIIVSWSLERESTIVFSDTWRAVIVIRTRHWCYIGYSISTYILLSIIGYLTFICIRSVWSRLRIRINQIKIFPLPVLSATIRYFF